MVIQYYVANMLGSYSVYYSTFELIKENISEPLHRISFTVYNNYIGISSVYIMIKKESAYW